MSLFDEAKPLSKQLHDALVAANVISFTLAFSGGSDNGYLDVSIDNVPYGGPLAKKVEKWAWDNYCFSGAGDGSEYGCKITYNLGDQTVTLTNWETQVVERVLAMKLTTIADLDKHE